MALIQTAQVAEWLGWSADKVTERQADLTRVAEAASTGIRRMCGRDFEPANGQTRVFDVPVSVFELMTGDVRAVTAVDTRRSVNQDWTPISAGGWSCVTAHAGIGLSRRLSAPTATSSPQAPRRSGLPATGSSRPCRPASSRPL